MKKISWIMIIFCLAALTLNQPILTICSGFKVSDNDINKYQLVVDGNEKEIYTFDKDVDKILAKENIDLKNKDYVAVDSGKDVTNIRVVRCYEDMISTEVEVPYNRVVKYNSAIREGTKRTLRSGEPGKKVLEYKVVYEDGLEKSRTLKGEKIIKKPQTEIVEEGKRQMVALSVGRAEKTGKVMQMSATAYTHTGHRTCTGVYPHVGTVAVDPRIIPLGTKMYVEGYGYAIAEDTGGAIKGKIVDVFLETRKECVNWGRRKVKVYILE